MSIKLKEKRDIVNNYETNTCSNDNHTCNQNSPRFTVGMTYVPMQEWTTPMRIEDGFMKGTIFCDLNKPFCPQGR